MADIIVDNPYVDITQVYYLLIRHRETFIISCGSRRDKQSGASREGEAVCGGGSNEKNNRNWVEALERIGID